MFYYKTSILLFNCFLFPYIFLHQGKYIIIFSLPLRTGQAHLRYPCLAASTFSAGCIMSLRLSSPLHHAPVFQFSLPLRTGQAYLLRRHPCFTPTTLSPHSRLRNVLRSSAHTVSLRFALGELLRKRCSATLARCLHVPLPIQFTFSQKFSFPCGSTGSLKSAFIIEGLSIFGEQVSPA